MPDRLAACEAAGMDDHIAKPIEPRQLLTTVMTWTSRADLNDQATVGGGRI